MRIKPWQFDAGAITYNTDPSKDLLMTKEIRSFLLTGDRDHKFVLMGPKGVGKTLLINLKSWYYRHNSDGESYGIYPRSEQLCENIQIESRMLSIEALLNVSKSSLWEGIWFFILGVLACRTTNIDIPEEIATILPSHEPNVSEILTHVLNNRSKLGQYIGANEKLIGVIGQINSGALLFLDNLDQALTGFLTEYDSDRQDFDGNNAIEVWVNAQVGLLDAIYRINRQNSHIKVFATIRQEAFESSDDPRKENWRNYCIKLKYDVPEVKEIFDKNIKLMSTSDLVNPNGRTLIEKFLGFDEMPHIFAKKANGHKRRESALDFFYRHTFGRPREIIYLGQELFNDVLSHDGYKKLKTGEQIEKVRWKVNEVSSTLFEDYSHEIVPKFDSERLTSFLDTIQCNVIAKDFVKENIRDDITYYYKLGMVGYTVQKSYTSDGNLLTQKFVSPATHSYKKSIILPRSQFYITHPSLDGELKNLWELEFYNRHNIIGAGYDFRVPDNYFVFDVALSFAGEDRAYVQEVADELKRRNKKVFYDSDDRTNLWGNDVYQRLSQVFGKQARFCVIFSSEYYLQKDWTNHELKIAAKSCINRRKRVYSPRQTG